MQSRKKLGMLWKGIACDAPRRCSLLHRHPQKSLLKPLLKPTAKPLQFAGFRAIIPLHPLTGSVSEVAQKTDGQEAGTEAEKKQTYNEVRCGFPGQ